MPDYEDMILARQEIMEIAEDDDIYESLLSGGYLKKMKIWMYGCGVNHEHILK